MPAKSSSEPLQPPSMASPPPQEDSDAVCCMCGDHGLPGELFRCRACLARLQHRYCSDLYPRAAAYRRCNWCLREPADHGAGAGHAAAAQKHAEMKRKAATSASDEEPQRHEGWSRMPTAEAELGRPVKKRKADEKLPPSPGAAKGSDASDGKNKVMRAGKTPARVNSRVKVRRYKLLAEVISCQ